MSIKEQIAKDNAIFLDVDAFAEEITYNGAPILAVVAIGDSAIRGNTFEGRGRAAVGTVQVSALDVPSPNTGDVVVYKTTTWTVARMLESDTAMHLLQIISGESAF